MTDRVRPVASWRHTLVVCAVLLGVALFGFIQHGRAQGLGTAPAGPMTYLALIAAEAGLGYFVWRGLRRAGMPLLDIISRRPLNGRAVAVDVALGLALFAALRLTGQGLAALLGHGDQNVVGAVVANARAWWPLWALLSLAAAFVEELTYRGYLQRQFGARAGRSAGVGGQALLFGITHGYQGGVLMLTITVSGLLFGAAAALRGSLLPGVLAHAVLDITGGLRLLG